MSESKEHEDELLKKGLAEIKDHSPAAVKMGGAWPYKYYVTFYKTKDERLDPDQEADLDAECKNTDQVISAIQQLNPLPFEYKQVAVCFRPTGVIVYFDMGAMSYEVDRVFE